MSQLRSFSIIGDSNVKRNMVSSTTSGRPPLASAQVLICGRLSLLSANLEKVKAVDGCILACVTNFITGSLGGATDPGVSMISRVEGVFSSYFGKIVAFCHNRPSTFFFMCSPMYRTTPIWYRDGLPEILVKFSRMWELLEDRPHNLLLLPSFQRVQLDADGVHLTPF